MHSFHHFFRLVFWIYFYPVKGILCISFSLQFCFGRIIDTSNMGRLFQIVIFFIPDHWLGDNPPSVAARFSDIAFVKVLFPLRVCNLFIQMLVSFMVVPMISQHCLLKRFQVCGVECCLFSGFCWFFPQGKICKHPVHCFATLPVSRPQLMCSQIYPQGQIQSTFVVLGFYKGLKL